MRKNSVRVVLAVVVVLFSGLSEGWADSGAQNQASDETWHWQPVEDSACGDGSPTGYGVNISAKASRSLAIFFAGGGACRDYFECYILHTAANIDGYDEQRFYFDIETLKDFPLNDRSHAGNPFAAMHMAWFPYCTGDLHAGHRVADYGAYHLGGDNTAKYLEGLAVRFPHVEHVWLVGFSAGGFGAVLNWEVAQQTFPSATIHVIDDSGLAFGDSSAVPEQWEVVKAPDDCIGCQEDMSRILPYIAKRSPKSRVAWVSYEADSTLPYFLSLARSDFADDLQKFADEIDAVGPSNLAYFYASGEGHVVTAHADADGIMPQFTNWLGRMVHRKGDWESERPSSLESFGRGF